MKNINLIAGTLVLSFCCSGFAADPPADGNASPPVAKAPAAKAAPAKQEKREPEQEVTYDDLDKYMGQRVIVHSKLGTTRSGKLVKHTMSEIAIIQDGSEYQFSFARDSIRSLGVPLPPPEAKTPDTGDAGAKKN